MKTNDIIPENFNDGKKPGRKGLAKRSGVDCKDSVTDLRKIAKNSTGERARMAHWCANMKSGRAKNESELTEGTLSIDVPNEAWLQDKIDYAKSKGRNSYGVPYMGSTTAAVRGTPPRVRVLRLASLPGMRNEQTNVRRDDLKWLMDYMDTHKKLPPMGSNPDEEYLPYIMVAWNGEAWVNEGNHRIMAAYRLNWPDLPIEIRYFDGGERIKTGPMYPGKIGLGEVEVPQRESVAEGIEPGEYVYHASNLPDPQAGLKSVLMSGLKPSKDGYAGPGVYFAYDPEGGFYHVDKADATVFRARWSDLVNKFGRYPDNENGIQRDDNEIIVPGRVPADMLEVEYFPGEWWDLASAYEASKGPLDITEAFDRPYRLRWEQSDYGDVDAYAKMDDGNYLSIMFNKGVSQGSKEEAWSVEFFRNNSQEVTGEGDAQRVFATVLSAIQTFIKKYKPNRVIFSASKEVEQGQNAQSRARLYDSLVQRYARAWGFRAFRADTGNKVIYELNRIKPIPAPKAVEPEAVPEARTNPDQSTRHESGFKELAAVAKTIADPENWAVSMTAEPKLGINPQVGISEDTPKGIYFYPLNYALDKTRYGKLPWGHDYPYIQLFQYDRSGEMTKDTTVDPAKLKQALSQYCSEEVIQSAIDEPEYDGTPYWFIYDCLSRLGKNDETNVVRWNKVLRDLGFTSVYDDGAGWIAYNEPTQGVVLDPRVIKQLKTITNKKQSGVVTPAVIERAIFETMDMELAANRAWQAYDPDGSKLKAAAKEYAKKPEFKQYYGKPGTEEIFNKAEGWGRYGARQLSQEAYEWFKQQQGQKTESINEIDAGTVTNLFAVFPTISKIIVYNALNKAKQEKNETAQMIDVLTKVVTGKTVTPDEYKLAHEQFKDLLQYGIKAVVPAVSSGVLAGLSAVYKKELIELIKNKGPAAIVDMLQNKNIDIVKTLYGNFLGKHTTDFYTAPKKTTESVVNEGGWASTETQNTVITPKTVAEIVHILDGFEASYNAWQAANELDTEIKIGSPKGSGTYYRRDLEQDPEREYGDVDVECFIHSREGIGSAQRVTEYRRAIKDYCDQSPDFSTDNGTNVIMRTTAGPVQVDLIYTFHEHADWSRVLSPEYRVKGVISTSLTSALAEALNLSFSSQGIQVKIRNNQPVSFRQSKDTELRTVTNKPETWAQDVYALYYYLSHGEKPAEMPRDLRAHGGFKDEQRLSDIVLSIKALAAGLEEAGLLGHGSLIGIPDKKDLIRKVAQIYSAKLEAAENSSKFDKASTPAAVEKAKKTKLMLAKYRNEVTKLLLN